MAYSESLAERIRQALAPLASVKEQKMFGGIAFIVNGKMCVGAYSGGDMMVRCDQDMADELITKKGPVLATWYICSDKYHHKDDRPCLRGLQMDVKPCAFWNSMALPRFT